MRWPGLRGWVGLGALALVAGACSGPTDADPEPTHLPAEPVVAGPRWEQIVRAQAVRAGVPVPTDKPVRLVSADEADAAMVKCMRELGLATDTNGHGPGEGVEGGTKKELDQARIVCMNLYPLRGDILDPDANKAQLRVEYRWLKIKTIPCLQGLGLETDPMPSLEDFIAGYRDGEPLWFPGDYTAAQRELINDNCDLLPNTKDSP